MIGDKLSFILFNVVGGATTLALGGLLYAQHTGNFEIGIEKIKKLKKKEISTIFCSFASSILIYTHIWP